MNKFQNLLPIYLVSVITLLPCYGFAVDLPADPAKALRVTHQWLNTLNQKSPEAIKKLLGEPKVQRTWSIHGKDEPVWDYEVSNSNQRIMLYYYNGKVIKGSLQLLTD